MCPTLCNPMDCSPPGFSVRGIFQARLLDWVAISSSRGSSQPRDQTCVSWVSYIIGRCFTPEPPGKQQYCYYCYFFPGSSVVKNPPASAEDTGDLGLIPGSGRSPGGGNGNPLQYSCGKPHGQRSLAGYSPWGCTELDTNHFHKTSQPNIKEKI